METVLSKTGIEVRYPCTVHLLHNGENFECNYKSDYTGGCLLKYVCKVQKIHQDFNLWGLKFMDVTNEQRYWLDLDKLIRTQMKNVNPTRLYFRVKVYPPEPYKIADQSVRRLIFQQLRLDLLGGRLFCGVDEAAMLVALILQHVHGNFTSNMVWMYLMYLETKVLRKERCSKEFFASTQTRALLIFQKLLVGLSKLEVEDMFLRLASKLDSYGVEPFLVRNIDKTEVVLWLNYTGVRAFDKRKKTMHLTWGQISKITHEGRGLFVHRTVGGVVVLECVSYSECAYVWSCAMDHLIYFTSVKWVSRGASAPSVKDNSSEISGFLSDFRRNIFQRKTFDWTTWTSHLSVFYTGLLLYVVGSSTAIFDELPYVDFLRDWVKRFMSNLVFNKLLTY